MNNIEEAKNKLKRYNQTNILQIIDKLDTEKQKKLSEEILKLDFEKVLSLYNSYNNKNSEKNIEKNKSMKIEPLDVIEKKDIEEEEKERLSKIGEKAIRENKYAIVTMAGGQGTRLGFDGPKGAFKLKIGNKEKYIFEILIDQLKQAKDKYGVEICWYIMTSQENDEATKQFFEKNNYFGYNEQKVKFFKQSSLPLVDENGNLLIDKNFNIKLASDGNGSIYKSLKKSGMLQNMKEEGIEFVHICNVDNINVVMVDEIFIGLAIDENVDCVAKSVKKACPEEKVGVFCKINNKPSIVEYSDMDTEMLTKKKPNGELVYNDSSIGNFLFSINKIEKIAQYELEYHLAHKKNSYIDVNLKEILPENPNTYKFETFIFDGFAFLENMIIMSVNRDEEFAPIKNATGVDSPQTAIELFSKKILG